MADKKRSKAQKKADRKKTVNLVKVSSSRKTKVRKISANAARRTIKRKMAKDVSPKDKPLTLLIKNTDRRPSGGGIKKQVRGW